MAIATQQITTQQITNIRASSGLDVVAGLWLILSPFVLAFSAEPAALWSTLISGIVIGALAASRSLGEGYQYAWPSWINLLAGIWLVVAPSVLSFASTVSMWNSVISGAIVIALSIWAIASTPAEEEL